MFMNSPQPSHIVPSNIISAISPTGCASSFARLSRHSADVAETDGHSGLEAIKRTRPSHFLAGRSFVPVNECDIAS